MQNMTEDNVGIGLRDFLEFLRERVNVYKWRFHGPFLNYQESRQKAVLDLFTEVEEKWVNLFCRKHGHNDANEDRVIIQAIVQSCVTIAERVGQSIYITVRSTGRHDFVGDLLVPDGCCNYIAYKRMMYSSGHIRVMQEEC